LLCKRGGSIPAPGTTHSINKTLFMKIIKEEQDLLVLKNDNTLFFIVGAIFLIFGPIIIFKPELLQNHQPPAMPGIAMCVIGLSIYFSSQNHHSYF